jgi:hypothetical protein
MEGFPYYVRKKGRQSTQYVGMLVESPCNGNLFHYKTEKKDIGQLCETRKVLRDL